VAGISIGAINAALIAGNSPEMRGLKNCVILVHDHDARDMARADF